MKIVSFTKKTFIAGCGLLLLASTAYAAEYKTVTKDNVNVRTGPSTNNPVSMEVFKNYPLKVSASQGEWVKVVDFEGDGGWIHQSLLKKGDTVIVNAKKSANMRATPSTKAELVANMERGVVLTKIGKEGNWVKVRHSGGTVGWVYKKLLWP